MLFTKYTIFFCKIPVLFLYNLFDFFLEEYHKNLFNKSDSLAYCQNIHYNRNIKNPRFSERKPYIRGHMFFDL